MIKKIKWNNHKILGDLELDFTKEDGTIYDTILLAGENGTGKTTVFDTLSSFLNLGSFEDLHSICYEVGETTFTVFHKENDRADWGFHHRKNENDGSVERIQSNKETIDSDLEDIRHYGFAYSKARSGFKTDKIKATTTEQLDSDRYESDSDDNYTFIKQLIIDIDSQDNSDWMEITKSGSDTTFDEFKHSSKLFRFESAFNAFFDGLSFQKIDRSGTDEIKILFNKHGNSISVDDLSTGEKQIVFRGASLLKNINSMPGGVVLIDEPELSMHPKWQQKILQYYRSLFSSNGTQSVQAIFATHSEYVLRSALEDKENTLIIVLNDNNGTITPKRITAPSILPTVTAAETNYLAFKVLSTDYHIELYGYLQSKTGCDTVKSCDDYIARQTQYDSSLHEKPYSFINNRGQVVNYQTLPTFIRNQIDHPNPNNCFTDDELRISIELLIQLCK